MEAEEQYHAHEFLDATVQPKPIYISPNEVYSMHGLLAQHLDQLVRLLPLHKSMCLAKQRYNRSPDAMMIYVSF